MNRWSRATERHVEVITPLCCLLALGFAGEARAQTFSGSVTEDAFRDLPGTSCCNQCSLADPLDLSITGADPAATGDATITLEIRADVNDLDEILAVSLEGLSLGVILNDNPGTGTYTYGFDIQGRLYQAKGLFSDGFESGDTSAWSGTVP